MTTAEAVLRPPHDAGSADWIRYLAQFQGDQLDAELQRTPSLAVNVVIYRGLREGMRFTDEQDRVTRARLVVEALGGDV